MSETIAVGVITGAVAILSTLLTQVLSARSARARAQVELRAANARELHPLAVRALAEWEAYLSDMYAVLALVNQLGEELADIDDYPGPGRPSYRGAMSALDEIQLVTNNAELYGASTVLRANAVVCQSVAAACMRPRPDGVTRDQQTEELRQRTAELSDSVRGLRDALTPLTARIFEKRDRRWSQRVSQGARLAQRFPS